MALVSTQITVYLWMTPQFWRLNLKWFKRMAKEAIHIRVTHPFLNKDGGRYNLPSVWTNILNERTRGTGPRTSGSNQSLQDDTNAI